MSQYHAPLKEMQFVMTELAGLEQVAKLPGFQDATPDVVMAILEEAAKFATEVLDPLNASGDREGARRLDDGSVRTPKGFKDAYKQYCANGWNGLTKDPDFGGQGLPQLVATAVEEMWHAANMAFDLCPLLTQGAIEAIVLCGTPEQKARFLPKMVSGEWTGTMNLTEAQAGSDLAAVRTRAVPQDDGSLQALRPEDLHHLRRARLYRQHHPSRARAHAERARGRQGHLALHRAQVPPERRRVSLGARNDVQCVSLEHKLGIHASPTARARLRRPRRRDRLPRRRGEPRPRVHVHHDEPRPLLRRAGGRGHRRARLSARRGLRARPRAGQGGRRGDGAATATIIQHPDVRRMLLSMRAQIEAMRALAYVTAAALDNARAHPDAEARKRHQAFADLMIPIVKGWCTENAQEIAYTGVQVHGGMGYIEETGAAQHYRDARIITIYEGTTGIQANDLIGRKTARDAGRTALAVIAEMHALDGELAAQSGPEFAAIRAQFAAAVAALKDSVEWMVATYGKDSRAAHAASVPYLKLWGLTAGGWQMARSALVAQKRLGEGKGDADFYRAKIATARFYADYFLPQTVALKHAIVTAGESVLALATEQF